MMATATIQKITGVADPIQDLISKRDTAKQDELAAGQQVQELEIKKAGMEADRTKGQAEAKVKATEELTQRRTEREAQILKQKSAVDNAMMNNHFEPTKENLQDQVALFSLINVIGFAIGAGGKQNAQQAMFAMNGMLEGHQKGRADVFKEEQIKFDKNFKALQQKATFLETELRHALEEYTRDKRAADERADAAFAAAGADFMKTYAEKNGLIAAYERATEIRKAADKAVEEKRLRQQNIQDKIDAEARASDERNLEDKRRLAERKEFAQFAAGLKPGNYEYVTKDGKTYAINKSNPRDIQEVNIDFSGATKVGSQPKGGAGGTQQQFENITSADIGNAYFRVNEFLSKSKDGKIPEGSKFLRDKGTQLGVIDAYKNWMVNRTLPADLQENDAALLGIAFDVVAARAFGRSTGVTDSKIAQVVRQLPVEGDAESTKQAKVRMLLNQLEEPNRLLPINKQVDASTYMTSPASKQIYLQYGGKDTGEVAKGAVKGGKSYKTEAEAEAAFKAGTLKAGEKVIIDGVSGAWE